MEQERPQVSNPFAVDRAAAAPLAVAGALTQREVAEVQAQAVIARSMPRDEAAAMDAILQACTRPTLAEHALYQFARGGTDISGPSIRLMEGIAQRWGNMDFGWREVENGGGWSTVETWALDLQTNLRCRRTVRIQHIRTTKAGSYKLSDPRDVYEMVANQAARRLRGCLLAVIPGDVVEAAREQCEITLRERSVVTPDKVLIMLERFADLGVTRTQIEARIQRNVDAITPQLMGTLRKIYASIQDGMSKPEDWFEPPAPAAGQTAAAPAPVDDATGSGGGRIEQSRRDKRRAQNPTPAANATAPGTSEPDADAAARSGQENPATSGQQEVPPGEAAVPPSPEGSPDLWDRERQ